MNDTEKLPIANPVSPASELGLAEGLPVPAASTARLQRGRPFKVGESGNPNGRRPGSRNRLTTMVIDAISADFNEHGADVIARVRCGDPVTYLKFIGALVPRESVLQREHEFDIDFDKISLSDWIDLLDQLKRQASMRNELELAERGY